MEHFYQMFSLRKWRHVTDVKITGFGGKSWTDTAAKESDEVFREAEANLASAAT